jgi:hypothetical protein
MMSWARAIVRVPPFTGAELLPELDEPEPPPHAVSATAATAATAANLTRVDGVIDASSFCPLEGGRWRAPADAGDRRNGAKPPRMGWADRSVHYSEGEVFPYVLRLEHDARAPLPPLLRRW